MEIILRKTTVQWIVLTQLLYSFFYAVYCVIHFFFCIILSQRDPQSSLCYFLGIPNAIKTGEGSDLFAEHAAPPEQQIPFISSIATRFFP